MFSWRNVLGFFVSWYNSQTLFFLKNLFQTHFKLNNEKIICYCLSSRDPISCWCQKYIIIMSLQDHTSVSLLNECLYLGTYQAINHQWQICSQQTEISMVTCAHEKRRHSDRINRGRNHGYKKFLIRAEKWPQLLCPMCTNANTNSNNHA